MNRSERQLRRMIRKVLLNQDTTPVKIPKNARQLSDISFKKEFQKNADQRSLQQLAYIHWCNPYEAQSILGGSGKNEISTCIHSRKHKLVPWDMDESGDPDVPTIGLELKGFVTMASNLDLESGRHGPTKYRKTRKIQPDVEFQKMTSGIPKRSFAEEYLSRGQHYPEDGLIYSEKDLKIYHRYNYDSWNREWPEAILDNWRPIAMWYDDSKYDPDFYGYDNERLASVIEACKRKGLEIKKVSEWLT
jgi:hypothetical protein